MPFFLKAANAISAEAERAKMEIATYGERAKMEIATHGTNGNADVLKEAIFCTVRPRLAGAKEQHKITVEMRDVLMEAIGEDSAVWEKYEQIYFKHYPKNCAGSNAKVGSHTVVTVQSVLKKCVAATIMKVPNKMNTSMFVCREAQNELIEAALIQSSRGRTCRCSWDKPAAKKARMVVDMSLNYWALQLSMALATPKRKTTKRMNWEVGDKEFNTSHECRTGIVCTVA